MPTSCIGDACTLKVRTLGSPCRQWLDGLKQLLPLAGKELVGVFFALPDTDTNERFGSLSEFIPDGHAATEGPLDGPSR